MTTSAQVRFVGASDAPTSLVQNNAPLTLPAMPAYGHPLVAGGESVAGAQSVARIVFVPEQCLVMMRLPAAIALEVPPKSAVAKALVATGSCGVVALLRHRIGPRPRNKGLTTPPPSR